MLVMAALCFWIPHNLQKDGVAHQRVLVASPEMKDPLFQKTVVVIVKHNGHSALGFIVNKPGKTPTDPAYGGPVEQERTYALHTPEYEGWKSSVADIAGRKGVSTTFIEPMNLVYTDHIEYIQHILKAEEEKPKGYIIFNGFSGWGIGQLKREIRGGWWKVIEYDPEIIFYTSAEEMWERAVQRPDIRNGQG